MYDAASAKSTPTVEAVAKIFNKKRKRRIPDRPADPTRSVDR
jgi:hypothetical protein